MDGLNAQHAVKVAEITTFVNQNNAIVEQAHQNRQALLADCRASLGGLSTQGNGESNDKSVLDIYLQTLAIGQAPDTTQLASLYNIAIQCPAEAGPAVFLAGSLWQSCTGQKLNWDACVSGDRSNDQAQSREKSLDAITVYPNPSNDQLLVALPNGLQVDQLLVYNETGNLVICMKKPLGPTRIQTGNYANGVYALVLKAANGEVRTIKFVVQH